MQQSFTEKFEVQNIDVDFAGRLAPAALLRYVEHVSASHARADGIGESFLRPRGLAMLVGRQALKFERAPRRGEIITLVTVPEQSRHGSMKRITSAYDEAGRRVALVDARWILVDMQKGRILREPVWNQSAWQAEVEPELPQSTRKHGEGEIISVGTLLAAYSLCDENGHINNSRYMDIACDALPLSELKNSEVTYAALKYNREVPLGEAVELERARSGAGWYIAGRREGKAAFECYLELKPRQK